MRGPYWTTVRLVPLGTCIADINRFWRTSAARVKRFDEVLCEPLRLAGEMAGEENRGWQLGNRSSWWGRSPRWISRTPVGLVMKNFVPSCFDCLGRCWGIALLIALSSSLAASAWGQATEADARLDPAQFAAPANEYRPVDCWWWEQGYLTRERLRWQLEEMHAKGVGGTWLYPRFGASQPQSSEPGFWTDGWWEFVRYALDEHERLGMVEFSNDWLGRLDKAYFQSRLRDQRKEHPELTGQRLAVYRVRSSGAESLRLRIPENERVLSAAAYHLREAKEDSVDGASRVDLAEFIHARELSWDAPEPEWLAVVVTSQPHDLNYLGPAVIQKWIEIFFDQYRQRLGDRLGKSLVAYGPDERSVLSGNILYSDELRDRFRREKGYDPLPDLAALFLDIGPQTDRVRCQYYDVMDTLLEENLYEPTTRWLHEHKMKHVTIATWGRDDLLGQTSNYGDFLRMMKHFDMPGNEDSVQSGPSGAFIDTKLSSSIAHLNGRKRVGICTYWGMGWGFTPEQNIARTNVNHALGANLHNTNGVLYTLLAGRNEFVPPHIHFYQPYWQTWRTFTDYVSRLAYVLSQGRHRADVALLYPLSTIHAHWHNGSKFDQAADEAQRSAFAVAKAVYARSLDFDFIDEDRLAKAKIGDGKLNLAEIEFPVVVLPKMTTIRADAMARLRDFVVAGGTLVVLREPPTASAEQGRDDPELQKTWQQLLGTYGTSNEPVVEVRNDAGGRTILIRSAEADAAATIRAAIQPDVTTTEPDVIHTHQQIGNQHVYFFVNRLPQRRNVHVTVRCRGTPEIWDARTGDIGPLHRFETTADGMRMRLDMAPNAGVLVVVQSKPPSPQVIADNLLQIDEVNRRGEDLEVVGLADSSEELHAELSFDGRKYVGRRPAVAAPTSIALDGLWQCEYRPTMNNRWGDYRYPASAEMIGPEAPRVKYQAEPLSADKRPDWEKPDVNDADWQQVNFTFGPYWQVLGPFEERSDSKDLRDKIVRGESDTSTLMKLEGADAPWQPYVYSWKLGADRPDVHQFGGDGLGPVSPDFLVFDAPRGGKPVVRYLVTRVFSPSDRTLFLDFGGQEKQPPRQAWVNGEQVVQLDGQQTQAIGKVALRKGWNEVVLRLVQPAAKRIATFAVFHDSPQTPPQPRFMPLSRWYELSQSLVYDCRPKGQKSVGWYRFHAPPGTRRAKLNLDVESAEAWINGQPVSVVSDTIEFPMQANEPQQRAQVALRVQHKPGHYEGAAFHGPIAFECNRGQIPLGDWSQFGLAFYSGGLTYIRHVQITQEQLAHRLQLDLGDVRTSAELTVNGRKLGVRLARPFVFDITEAVRPGDNEIQVEVLNTLANHMSGTHSRYVFDGQTVSGLLGPATLRAVPRVKVLCRPEPIARKPG